MAEVEEYLDSLEPASRAVLAHIRDLALEIVPEAEEGTSYGMAALKYRNKGLLGFLAAKHHLSVFPFSSSVIDSLRDDLAGFDFSKGTIRFTVDAPLPDAVVREVVSRRAEEIAGTSRRR